MIAMEPIITLPQFHPCLTRILRREERYSPEGGEVIDPVPHTAPSSLNASLDTQAYLRSEIRRLYQLNELANMPMDTWEEANDYDIPEEGIQFETQYGLSPELEPDDLDRELDAAAPPAPPPVPLAPPAASVKRSRKSGGNQNDLPPTEDNALSATE